MLQEHTLDCSGCIQLIENSTDVLKMITSA